MITQKNNSSASVVYSFEGRWEDAIRQGEVRVFFRKRRPTRLPTRVFFYVGAPVKSIIGFADVEGISISTLAEAVAIRDLGAITESELKRYIGQDGQVNAIRVGIPTIFAEPLQLSDLKERFSFNPPQSFSIVSDAFEATLMGLPK
jgi:predicted transcriptional regulator